MTNHPLTDKILTQFGMPLDEYMGQFAMPAHLFVEGERVFFEEAMRAAADWQLEQVMKWLDKHLTNYLDPDYLGSCESIPDLEDDLKKAMRPTQEDS